MTYILSVGGSLIVPATGIDINFLKSFRRFVLKRYDASDRLIIVAGGGVTARQYVQAAAAVETVPEDDQDWLGIHATRLNAHLLRILLKDVAYPEIITNPDKALHTRSRVIVAGGYRPGWSTDYVAVLLANKYKAKTVINLSNIDYVYNQDPRRYPDAKIIKKINWNDFRQIVGNEWHPGLNAPFDPIAARLAQSSRLRVVILNGRNFVNLNKFFDNKVFKGTIIQ
ncbi:MAG TPA: UMP kinase [bacterium]|jgi:uridylate kinase|nr:UMP kinase [bacterium]HQL34768.1 UMP kinase [bacterium]